MSKFVPYFEQKGDPDSPAIVFLHAFPLHSGMWDAQFKALADTFHVVRYDVRGFGKSKGKDHKVTMELFTDDLLDLIDELNIPKPILCGLSMGGYIALRFAEKYPDRVEALILADTKSESDSSEARAKRAQGVEVIKGKGLEPFVKTFVQGAAVSDEAKAKMLKWGMESDPEGVAAGLTALAGRKDTTNALAKFDFATLVIVGKEDSLTPPEKAEALVKGIPEATLVVLEKAGHLSNLDQPDAFTAAIRNFAKEI